MSLNNPLQNPEIQEDTSTLQTWREDVFDSTIRIVGVLGSIAYFTGILFAFKETPWGFLLAYTLIYLWVMFIAFTKRIPTVYRAYSFIILLFSLGLMNSLEKAATGDGRIWLILSAILALIFLGQKAGLGFTIGATIAWIVIGYLFISSSITPPQINEYTFDHWIGTTITFFLASALIIRSMGALISNLNKSIEESQLLAKKSEDQSHELEHQRNALEERSNALEMTAKISRQLSSFVEKEDVLERLPVLLLEAFSLNSVAVFLLDEENVLHLASSSGWNEQVEFKSEDLSSFRKDAVGLAIIREKAVTNSDPEVETNYTLPGTLSYATLPLRGRNHILGSLLLQSESPDIFGTEKTAIFQIFTDQVALLLENAELLIQKESILDAERRAYAQVSQKAWGSFLDSQSYGSYRRDKSGISVHAAKPFEPGETEENTEQIPIMIRGNLVGHIDAKKPENRAWTVSEKELLRILTTRLESAIDSARLYQDTQEQAERERIISEASSQVRESLDLEGVLGAAAQELRKGLGLAEAEIWLSPEYLQDKDDTPVPKNNKNTGNAENKA